MKKDCPSYCRGWSRKMNGEVAKVAHQRRTAKFLVNWLGHVNCFVSSMCSCSCQCSTTIMKRMKQATLFGFLVLNMLNIPCLSDWFASHHTLCLQEWFVQVNQRVLKQRILWRLHTQGGWLATQFTPPDQPLYWFSQKLPPPTKHDHYPEVWSRPKHSSTMITSWSHFL